MKRSLAYAVAALLGLSGLAIAGTTLPPLGQVNNQTAAVPVTIVVPAIVSVWADYTPINLTVGQSDGNGFAGAAATLSHINNVPATISAKVDGVLPTGLGQVNFFIFDGGTVASAQAACQANAYTPAGALVWTDATMGTVKTFKSGIPAANAAENLPVVYAADIPGGVPAPPWSYDLVITWTITTP